MTAIILSVLAIVISVASIVIDILSVRRTRASLARIAVIRAKTERTQYETRQIISNLGASDLESYREDEQE